MSKRRAKTKRAVGRREFMQGVLVGGGAMAVTLAGGEVTAAETPMRGLGPEKTAAAGYQETAHVREYYKTVDE